MEQEGKNARKVERFLEQNYELDLYFDIEELKTGIEESLMVLRDYDDVHVELKQEIGGETYSKCYEENYFTLRDRLVKWTRDAKIEANKRKKHFSDQILDRLRTEEILLRKRINLELSNISAENVVLLEDFERQLSVTENLISDYTEMFRKIGEQGPLFLQEFEKDFDDTHLKLNQVVTSRREAISSLKQQILDEEKSRQNIEAKNKYLADKQLTLTSCKAIYENICDRFKDLEAKLQVQPAQLTDPELIDQQKYLNTIERNFHEILDKILKLSQSNGSRYEETADLSFMANQRKENLKVNMEIFRAALTREISERGISDEKIKNASLLGIELPKFGGYNSELDFYSFKTKFIQYFAPKVKPSLLVDYLKSNYLTGQALQLVKEINTMSGIWERLEESFGHVPTLLDNKLKALQDISSLDKIRGEKNVNEVLIKLSNIMRELSAMAADHGVETSLYHSSNIAKIYRIIGKRRHAELTKNLLDFNESEKDMWQNVLRTVEKEIRVNEQLILYHPAAPSRVDSTHFAGGVANQLICAFCDQSGHVPTLTKSGKTVIQYHSCEKFAKMNPKERLEGIKKKRLCGFCLIPGQKYRHSGKCPNNYACPHPSHKNYGKSFHILVCDEHKNDPANLQLLETYKADWIENRNQEDFSLNISIAFHLATPNPCAYEVGFEVELDDCEKDVSVYMLQTIAVSGVNLNLFYDNGCSDMVISKRALDVLVSQKRAFLISSRPSSMTGVGDLKTVSYYGRWRITLPLSNGGQVSLTGQCLERITGRFADYPLDEVGKDFAESYCKDGFDSNTLPRLPEFVGGDTDIMIGIQYTKYWPRYVHQLSNGCTLYRSQFDSSDGTRGVVGGPHNSFNDLFDDATIHHAYFSDEVRDFIFSSRPKLMTSSRLVESSRWLDSLPSSGKEDMDSESISSNPLNEPLSK